MNSHDVTQKRHLLKIVQIWMLLRCFIISIYFTLILTIHTLYNCLQIECGTGDIQHLPAVNSDAPNRDYDDSIHDG